ncbi:MAG TPA: DUF4062 domain-containing protein [Candidatus Obscuribacterales bacterium]|nr:DUF4062 domain-containing protein [Candidatus Obscuribacterales bacterium]
MRKNESEELQHGELASMSEDVERVDMQLQSTDWIAERRKYCEMSSLSKVLPAVDECFGMSPAELASHLLPYIVNRTRQSIRPTEYFERNLDGYHPDEKHQLKQVLHGAWRWLENEGFIGPDPEQTQDSSWQFVTLKALGVRTREDFLGYLKDGSLNTYHFLRPLRPSSIDSIVEAVAKYLKLGTKGGAEALRDLFLHANVHSSSFPDPATGEALKAWLLTHLRQANRQPDHLELLLLSLSNGKFSANFEVDGSEQETLLAELEAILQENGFSMQRDGGGIWFKDVINQTRSKIQKMPTDSAKTDRRYAVFVSSTFEDLKEERLHVIMTLQRMNCFAVGMEFFNAGDEDSWSVIKKQIDDCDYYLLVVGWRYGSLAPEGISFTQKEYRYALSIGKPIAAILIDDSVAINPKTVDTKNLDKVKEFRSEIMKKHQIGKWSTAGELAKEVSLALNAMIREKPQRGWVRGPSQD